MPRNLLHNLWRSPLGIAGIEWCPSRGLPELLDAEHELRDRLWYERTQRYLATPGPDPATNPTTIFSMLNAMTQLEQTSPTTTTAPTASEYEWGMLHGKLSALRWVLGDDWDSLDT
jgi:hypothetical protein